MEAIVQVRSSTGIASLRNRNQLRRMSDAEKISISRRRVEFLVIRRRFVFDYFCGLCECESRFLSLEDARAESGLTMRQIVRKVDTGEVHYLESLLGHLVICSRSLSVAKNESTGDVLKFEVSEDV